MRSRPRQGWGIGLVLAGSLIGVGCVAESHVPNRSASPDRAPLPVSSFAAGATPSEPEPWSRLIPAEPVTAPFGGIGNQFIIATTAYGDGFVAAGEDLQFGGAVNAAIWLSPDGTTWERLPTADNDLAHAQIDVVAASGTRLVALGGPRGGDRDTGGRGRTVWTSDDGRSWQLIGDEVLFDGASPSGLAGGPAGFVAWGDQAQGAPVFRSDDGTAWTRVSPGDLFAGAQIGSLKPFGRGFVAVGAVLPSAPETTVGGPDRTTAAAWWSEDGRTWEAATVDKGFGLQTVQVGATGLIAVGSGGCGGCVGPAALWESADGRTWRHVGDDVANWPMYASDGARIARDEWQGSGNVFESTDGRAWHPIGSHARVDSYGLTVGVHGILITESIPRGGAPDEVDAGVWYLAGE